MKDNKVVLFLLLALLAFTLFLCALKFGGIERLRKLAPAEVIAILNETILS